MVVPCARRQSASLSIFIHLQCVNQSRNYPKFIKISVSNWRKPDEYPATILSTLLVYSCLLCVVSVCCAVGTMCLCCDYSLIMHSPSEYCECDWPCQTRLAKWRFMLSVPRKLIICVSRPIPDNYANRWPPNQLSHYSTTSSSSRRHCCVVVVDVVFAKHTHPTKFRSVRFYQSQHRPSGFFLVALPN